jgi:hypothetical protein
MELKGIDAKLGTKLSDGVQFDDWEFETRAEIRKKGVLGIVLGEETRPLGSENSKAVKAWVARRDVATATIVGRLDPSQFAHIRDFEEDPAGMWARLRETHQSLGLGGAVVLWRKLHALHKSDDPSSMRAHIAAIRGLAEKLGRLYDDKPSDAQLIATLLASLPPAYDVLAISLDAHPQRDDLDFVISRLLNEETRQEAELMPPGVATVVPTTALAVRMRRDMSRITCFKCQKLGHYQYDCPEPGPPVTAPPRAPDVIANAVFTREYWF